MLIAGLWPDLAWAQQLPLPAGAELAGEILREADAYAVPVGAARIGPPPLRQIEGRVEIRAFRIPDGPAPERLIAPIRATLRKEGYDIALDCAAEACGGFDFRYGVEVLAPPKMHVDLGTFRALTAHRAGPKGLSAVSVLASRTGATAHLQLVTITPGDAAPARTISAPSAAPPSAGDLGAALDRDGHAVLEGIDFAPGSADLDREAPAALTALADWLAAKPDRRVVLVGHTDLTGALGPNIALSRRRAQAVRAWLERAGVAPDRLGAEGAGWLAPRASNETQEGRAANRRVEAVVSGVASAP